MDQRQATQLEAVEVRAQLAGRGRQGEHQPAQLCHPRQLLHRQTGLDGRHREEVHGERGNDPDVARGRAGQDHLLHGPRAQPGDAQRVRVRQAQAGRGGADQLHQVRLHHTTEHGAVQPAAAL